MIYNNEVQSFIINTKQRRNRKTKCEKQLKRRNLKSNFFIQPMDSNPIEGNKKSHISLIKKCIADGLDKVLILEDDFKIIESLDNLPPMPEKWDILYCEKFLGRSQKSIPKWLYICFRSFYKI